MLLLPPVPPSRRWGTSPNLAIGSSPSSPSSLPSSSELVDSNGLLLDLDVDALAHSGGSKDSEKGSSFARSFGGANNATGGALTGLLCWGETTLGPILTTPIPGTTATAARPYLVAPPTRLTVDGGAHSSVKIPRSDAAVLALEVSLRTRRLGPAFARDERVREAVADRGGRCDPSAREDDERGRADEDGRGGAEEEGGGSDDDDRDELRFLRDMDRVRIEGVLVTAALDAGGGSLSRCRLRERREGRELIPARLGSICNEGARRRGREGSVCWLSDLVRRSHLDSHSFSLESASRR